MDFKSKGISWVGNMYQRFETMCHEVDNIVNQDTVKYVENQVQTVGESMKKFCSDVVQVVDPVRCEAKAAALKGNAAVATYIKSIIGTEDHEHTAPFRQSYLEPGVLDANGVNQSTLPASGEFHEEVESDSAAGNIADVATNENCDLSTEENKTNENSTAPEALDLPTLMKKTSSASPCHNMTDSNEENACFSLDEGGPSTEVVVEELQTLQKVVYHPSDVSESVSDIINTVAPSEMAFSVASSCGSIFTEPRTLPENLFHSILENIESCDNHFNVAAHNSDSSSSLVSSISAPMFNEWEAETGFTGSKGLLSLELTDSSCSIVSSISSPILSRNKEEAVAGLTCLNSVQSLESIDRSNSLSSSVSNPIFSCSKGETDTGHSCSNSAMSLESTGCSNCYIIDDAEDSGMDTIDLSDKLKLEESCVFVDNSMLYEISRRINRQRSYKKKIQDAFSSKKRLSKEYEQLAIWFGDLDTESSQNAPISTSINLDPDYRIQHSQDSEWELL